MASDTATVFYNIVDRDGEQIDNDFVTLDIEINCDHDTVIEKIREIQRIEEGLEIDEVEFESNAIQELYDNGGWDEVEKFWGLDGDQQDIVEAYLEDCSYRSIERILDSYITTGSLKEYLRENAGDYFPECPDNYLAYFNWDFVASEFSHDWTQCGDHWFSE